MFDHPQTDPFHLFARYYLCLNTQGRYQFANGNQLAARMGMGVEGLHRLLAQHQMHPDSVVHSAFPLTRHQVDIHLLAEEAEGEEVEAAARQVFEAFLKERHTKRDWQAEMEAEQEEGG